MTRTLNLFIKQLKKSKAKHPLYFGETHDGRYYAANQNVILIATRADIDTVQLQLALRPGSYSIDRG